MRRGKGGAGSLPAATAGIPASAPVAVAEIVSVIEAHVGSLPVDEPETPGRLIRTWTLTVSSAGPVRVGSAVRRSDAAGDEPDAALTYGQLVGIAGALRAGGFTPTEVFEGWRTVAYDVRPAGTVAPDADAAPAVPATGSVAGPVAGPVAEPGEAETPAAGSTDLSADGTAGEATDAPAAAAVPAHVPAAASTGGPLTDATPDATPGATPGATPDADSGGAPAHAAPRRRRFRFRGVRPSAPAPTPVGASADPGA
jgi:hypothetical protein